MIAKVVEKRNKLKFMVYVTDALFFVVVVAVV